MDKEISKFCQKDTQHHLSVCSPHALRSTCSNQGFIKSLKVAVDFQPGVSQVDSSTMGQPKPSCLNLFMQGLSKVTDFCGSQNISHFFQLAFSSALKFLVKMESKPGKLCLI